MRRITLLSNKKEKKKKSSVNSEQEIPCPKQPRVGLHRQYDTCQTDPLTKLAFLSTAQFTRSFINNKQRDRDTREAEAKYYSIA
jgi:hypothetical protein